MIREEEIREAAKEFVFGDKPETSDFFDMVMIDNFYHSAKWADKTMLDKACEWLEEKLLCAEDHYPTLEFLSIIEYNSLKELINDFRKSMEE